MLFNDQTLSTVNTSINRAKQITEESRRVYATELIDTYNGFGKTYLESLIKSSFSKTYIADTMVKLMEIYPILQNFINEVSAVYNYQPERTFYKDGRLIVKKLPEGADGEAAFLDKDKYEVDPDLATTLENIYNLELRMRIKNAESLTNLLNTTIYKVNNREGKLRLDFIPNDTCTIHMNDEDPTQMNSIYFLKNAFRDSITSKIKLNYEYWTLDEYWTSTDGNESEHKPNRARVEWTHTNKQLHPDTEEEIAHIGSGFAPFWVARAELADDDFWNVKDQDTIDVIKQINMAFTELRYLQRYGSFGLKYVVGAKVPEDATIDLIGVMQMEQNKSSVPGAQSDPVDIGEFKNEGRIKELVDSIFECLKFLYSLKGISTERLITSKQATTAESKKIDRESLIKRIQAQQDLWKYNEEQLFHTLVSVYNRDNTKKIPWGVTLSVDYYDADDTADNVMDQVESTLVKIENNIMTRVDWLKEENPDLSDGEATALLERNSVLNSTGSLDVEDESLVTENIDIEKADK